MERRDETGGRSLNKHSAAPSRSPTKGNIKRREEGDEGERAPDRTRTRLSKHEMCPFPTAFC